MKKILGLDLGTTSIGWAYVKEAENKNEKSEIVDIGVRVNPLSTDEKQDFEKGRPLSLNAERTRMRGARRNLQRFKLRRNNLINILTKNHIINKDTILTESGKNTTHKTLKQRAKSVKEKINLDDFARVLLMINKKRGYKSNRKAKGDEDGSLIDGMQIAERLYEDKITPGQYCYDILKSGKKTLPDFYRSDLQNEFDKIWNFQKVFHSQLLDDELLSAISGQGLINTRNRIFAIKNTSTVDTKGTRKEKLLDSYRLRSEAINKKLSAEEVASVVSDINGKIKSSSGYLGAISDRSKELFFNKVTVGEFLYEKLKNDSHYSLKNKVFYRQDYLDEFESIWETQKQFHPQLTEDLKIEVRDIIIFYQRKLKSQKGLLSFCSFESKNIEVVIDGKKKLKTRGMKVIPKSSPLFQEFNIWSNINNIELRQRKGDKQEFELNDEQKQSLYEELNLKGNLKGDNIFKLFKLDKDDWDINYSEIQGNRTNKILFETFIKILDDEGYVIDMKKESANKIKTAVSEILTDLGIDSSILEFDPLLDGKALENQSSYKLWHLLYSYEGDNSKTGHEGLAKKLMNDFGFKAEHVPYILNINFEDDYGSLSAKAIRKILPYLRENNKYSEACALAGYNHSSSITKEENKERELKDRLTLLEKNCLRNPVVEKILNQMVNVVNAIIDDSGMGKPDEIRIELARELKKSTKERKLMTEGINKAKNRHEQIKKLLNAQPFNIMNPSRNDIIRYKLWEELKENGYKTLYTNEYIPPFKVFSKDIDVEHIIPQALLFDDSFSNKTLEFRNINIDKGNKTAYDYLEQKFDETGFNEYKQRVDKYYKDGYITKAKYQKLLKKSSEIGDGFIERDLRESQYIAKKAKEMMLEICRTVVSTSGSITDRLRQDWGLINVMKELNLPKYRLAEMTTKEERRGGRIIEQIKNWTKRNDHRHHAMDALTVAFTKHSHIQYLNHLNARSDEKNQNHSVIHAIENKETEKSENGKRIFVSPMPEFREEAKKHLKRILVSHKAKNKVLTRNRNITKKNGGKFEQVSFTPRGQLHKETIYSRSNHYVTKLQKINSVFDENIINKVANKAYREALMKRFKEYDNDPKKAFSGKNSVGKNPVICHNGKHIPKEVKIVSLEHQYTIRKEITPDIKIDKIVDVKIRNIVRNRVKEFNGKQKEALSNLEKNPLWLNEKNGIKIKRVTITGVRNAEPIHTKKDHHGIEILDKNNFKQPVDFVSTGNNHHVAIYRDKDGNMHEEVVSFYEAVTRKNAGVPIIQKNHPLGYEFLFTLKQNEMFVFPSDDFNPSEINLKDEQKRNLISNHLFRVQKLSGTSIDYWFRHHLETTLNNDIKLKNKTYIIIASLKNLGGVIKVRLNHLGKIVAVGEY